MYESNDIQDALVPEPSSSTHPGPLETAAEATLSALAVEGLLQDRHALTCQLVRQLSRAVDQGFTARKVTIATATLSKHLLEAVGSLPQPAESTDDKWDEFMTRLEEVSHQG